MVRTTDQQTSRKLPFFNDVSWGMRWRWDGGGGVHARSAFILLPHPCLSGIQTPAYTSSHGAARDSTFQEIDSVGADLFGYVQCCLIQGRDSLFGRFFLHDFDVSPLIKVNWMTTRPFYHQEKFLSEAFHQYDECMRTPRNILSSPLPRARISIDIHLSTTSSLFDTRQYTRPLPRFRFKAQHRRHHPTTVPPVCILTHWHSLPFFSPSPTSSRALRYLVSLFPIWERRVSFSSHPIITWSIQTPRWITKITLRGLDLQRNWLQPPLH